MNQPAQYDPGIELVDVTAESQRQFNLCNACRYCEGFCPVFPAMSAHRWHDTTNLHLAEYFAHLCHQCTACYHACQYKSPHMYAVNLPQALNRVRLDSFQAHAWPMRLSAGFTHNPILTFVCVAVAIISTLVLAFALQGTATVTGVHTGPGAFYEVISHTLIVLSAGLSLGFAVLAMLISWHRYAHSIGLRIERVSIAAWWRALRDSLQLTHLGGGHGQGCNVEDERFSNQRRWLHHCTAYGFALCFAATCAATVYELGLGIMSPFPITSLPVVLGTVGGIGLIIGPIGLLLLKHRFHSAVKDPTLSELDTTLCVSLLLISLTGFALLLARETAAMGILLAIHLGFVLAFFVSLPYGKFVHMGYRFLALLKSADESV